MKKILSYSIITILFLCIIVTFGLKKYYQYYYKDFYKYNNTDYFEIITKEFSILKDINENIDNFSNKDRKIFIASISKSIFSSGILLFSLDKNNNYLFNNKNINITIKELLVNRKKYLDSLYQKQEITINQRNKLVLINLVLPLLNKKIGDVKIYQILNHTSIFANTYGSYSLFDGFFSNTIFLPQKLKSLILIKSIEFYTNYIYYNEKGDFQYSNISFFYLREIMDLMTDEDNFFKEIKKRILKPLNIEDKIIPYSNFSDKDKKILSKNVNEFVIDGKNYTMSLINLGDYAFTETDGTIGIAFSDPKTLSIYLNELIKMYLGIDNKINGKGNKIIKAIFYNSKYNTLNGDDEYYSLGVEFHIKKEKNLLNFLEYGNVGGNYIEFKFYIPIEDNYDYINTDIEQYAAPNYSIEIHIKNRFLEYIFLQKSDFSVFKSQNNTFNKILAKSIYDLYKKDDSIDYKLLFNDINNDFDNFINKLKNRINYNKNIIIKNKKIRNIYNELFNEYFCRLRYNFEYKIKNIFYLGMPDDRSEDGLSKTCGNKLRIIEE